MSLAALKVQLADIVAGLSSQSPALRTGLLPLDALLPSHGIAPGRLTELLALPGAGKTTIARTLVATTLVAGHGVAWVDATRTLDPRDWADVAGEGLCVIRPPDPARGAWCADLLLRTGAFALVVLDGAPVLSRTLGVRLTQLARESDSALLVLGDGPKASDLGGAVRLRASRAKGAGTGPPRAGAAITVTLERGGPYHHVTLEIAHDRGLAHRLHPHPEVPDRRSVVRRPTRLSREPARGRRCAQPDYPAPRTA